MLFAATLSHDPENCWAREENEAEARTWIAGIDDRAERNDINLRGAYVTPNEHKFYLVVEAEDLTDVTRFLGSPFLEDHEGRVAPILPLKEGFSTVLED